MLAPEYPAPDVTEPADYPDTQPQNTANLTAADSAAPRVNTLFLVTTPANGDQARGITLEEVASVHFRQLPDCLAKIALTEELYSCSPNTYSTASLEIAYPKPETGQDSDYETQAHKHRVETAITVIQALISYANRQGSTINSPAIVDAAQKEAWEKLAGQGWLGPITERSGGYYSISNAHLLPPGFTHAGSGYTINPHPSARAL